MENGEWHKEKGLDGFHHPPCHQSLDKELNGLTGAHEGASPTDPKLRISTTQGNNRISEGSPGEAAVLRVEQKPEVSTQTSDTLQ